MSSELNIDTDGIVELIIEMWRFKDAFKRVLDKIPIDSRGRSDNQMRYFERREREILEQYGFKLINLEGLEFDAGMAATAMNLDEFNESDELVVVKMLEPVIMGPEGIIKAGTMLVDVANIDKKIRDEKK